MFIFKEGIVDRDAEHIKLYYKEDRNPTAMVAKPEGDTIIYQFISNIDDTQEPKRKVLRELEIYFNELKNPDPWGYAIYHCSTVSNVYSNVHWSYYPEGWQPR
jgi:hypothetical protein